MSSDSSSGPQLVGGHSQAKPATPEVQKIAEKVRPDVEQITGPLNEFVVEQFKSQVVNGVNYSLKIRIAPGKFVHAKVYQPANDKGPQLTGLEQGKTSDDQLTNIPSF